MLVINTHSKYEIQSTTAKSESNDCVVRAFASAFDIKYDEAHEFLKTKFNRKPNKGCNSYIIFTSLINSSTKINNKKVEMVIDPITKSLIIFNEKTTNEEIKNSLKRENAKSTPEIIKIHKLKKIKVKTFIRHFPKGTYIVTVKRHAFTVKNGVIYGNIKDGKRLSREIKTAFKIS